MDIHTLKKLETKAVKSSQSDFFKMGIALTFMLGVLLYAFGVDNVTKNSFLIIAAVFGAYMALNIGANDVANNVGPAVGSQALTMTGAIIIAAIFEAAGALIAGGDVVSGAATVILAMGAGKDASVAMHDYITSKTIDNNSK